jgi:hypothetical protein
MVDKVGGISAVKAKILTLISTADASLSPEASHVFPNWRTEINYLESNYPVVTVRLGNVIVGDKTYGRQIGNNTRGQFVTYIFTAHVWDENNTSGPKSKDVCDLADKIIDVLENYSGDNVSGIKYFENITARESEPERGPQRLSRVIIEGFIVAKRPLA